MRFFWIWLLCCVGAGAATPPMREAERILESIRQTRYTHKPYVDEDRGIYDFDCSSFAAYVLSRVRVPAYDELVASAPGAERPLAKDFVAFFEESHAGLHWSRVYRVREMEPGDLVAWLLPPTSTAEDTGHVFFVASRPVANPAFAGEWLVTAIDAAASGHGPADPRRAAGPNGVGEGTIGLVVDSREQPVGFRWSGGTGKVKTTKIRMARALHGTAP